MLRRAILALSLLGVAAACPASQVQVVGLFPGAAVINVDGQRKLVREGQSGPGDVMVVRVDKQGAILRVDGVERLYPLSREYSSGFAEPVKKRLSIAKGPGGHYWITGSINGTLISSGWSDPGIAMEGTTATPRPASTKPIMVVPCWVSYMLWG